MSKTTTKSSIKSKTTKKALMTIGEIMGITTKGDIGFEMEIEFKKMPNLSEFMGKTKLVHVIEDNSLRSGYEFMANGALSIVDGCKAIEEVCTFLKTTDYRLSPRTSTHFHLNMLDLNEVECLNTLILSWYFEEFIKSGLESYRQENNFCMTIQDSDEFVFSTVEHLKNGGLVVAIPATRDYSKYSATNIATLMNLGTFEYRQFHSSIDPKLVTMWAKNLHSMKHFAMTFKTVLDLFEYLFAKSFTDVANKAFVDPSAFGDVKSFPEASTNLFYISKLVDAFDPEVNASKKKDLHHGDNRQLRGTDNRLFVPVLADYVRVARGGGGDNGGARMGRGLSHPTTIPHPVQTPEELHNRPVVDLTAQRQLRRATEQAALRQAQVTATAIRNRRDDEEDDEGDDW